MTKVSKLIELKDITKTYFLEELSVPVLKGISLEIEQGDYVALMGASGSGKSTLMNILGCLDRPTSGDYLLEGEELGRASGDRRAMIRNRKIGFVFQSFNLLPRTSAIENVIMPLAYTAGGLSVRERHRRGMAALEQVGTLCNIHARARCKTSASRGYVERSKGDRREGEGWHSSTYNSLSTRYVAEGEGGSRTCPQDLRTSATTLCRGCCAGTKAR